MKHGRQHSTPVRAALRVESPLAPMVQNGFAAMEARHKDPLAAAVRSSSADSLDLDKALVDLYPEENRWDYLLGWKPTHRVIALEPHSADQGEVPAFIRKRTAAERRLRDHLKPGRCVSTWLWVASGTVSLANTEKGRRALDENGIRFVGHMVLAKHLA